MTTHEHLLQLYPLSPASPSTAAALKCARQALQNIQTSIGAGSLTIPEQQKPLAIIPKTEMTEAEEAQRRLQSIQDQKLSIQQKMEAIKREEETILSQRLNYSRTSNKHFKSRHTAEDALALKALQAEGKKFEAMLEEKTMKYEENLKKFQEEEAKAVEEHRRKQLLKKKEEIEKSIELMEKRRSQQLSLRAEESRKVQSLLQERKLFEDMQRKWKEAEEEETKRKEQIKQEMKKMKRIDFEEIKEHEKKYEETMKQQRESKAKNCITFDSSLYQSRFMDNIKSEEEHRKEVEELRKMRLRELVEKKKEYGEQVRVVHKPLVKPSLENKQNQSKVSASQTRSLSLFEAHEKGNQYMRNVNQKLAEMVKENPPAPKEEPKAFKYTNYLMELKNKSSSSERPQKKRSEEEIKKIMNSGSMSKEEKIYRAKLVAEKLEEGVGRNRDSVILSGINAKLAILKQLEMEE